jgi:hypothetical protein
VFSRVQVRPRVVGLAGERSKAKPLKLTNFPNSGEIKSSGGGATTVVRSAAEEEIWVVESHVQTGGACRGEEHIPSIGSERMDQQPLDPEVSA